MKAFILLVIACLALAFFISWSSKPEPKRKYGQYSANILSYLKKRFSTVTPSAQFDSVSVQGILFTGQVDSFKIGDTFGENDPHNTIKFTILKLDEKGAHIGYQYESFYMSMAEPVEDKGVVTLPWTTPSMLSAQEQKLVTSS